MISDPPPAPLPQVLRNRVQGERNARCVPPAIPLHPAEQQWSADGENRGHAR